MNIAKRRTVYAAVAAVPLALGTLAFSSHHEAAVKVINSATATREALRLPACAEDAPVIETSPDCVWFDVTFAVVRGGVTSAFERCATEDSVNCVWDSAEQGSNRTDYDAPDRFVVNP